MTALDVHADLVVEIDGVPVRIEGQGDAVVVDVPGVRTGRRLMAVALPGGDHAAWLARADAALRDAGLRLDVRVAGVRLGRLGRGAQPGSMRRLLALHQAAQRSSASVPARVRRSPGRSLLAAFAGGAALGALVAFLRRG
ncbi:MAG: hypothetical protein R3247_11625 [Rhodothermales bacterium]|nr:hypothetical protein [Rhodothermales bacterium]